MFGIKIDSWEKLVSEFAQELDMSNMEAWPYVDLTDQSVGTHVNSNYGDTTCEEGLNGHDLVEIEPKSSHEGYELMERFAEERLRDYAIEFKDGKIVCTNPKNITVFECETDDDEDEEEEK